MAQLHVRFEGQSYDLTFNQLDISEESSDTQVLNAVAGYLDTSVDRFKNFVVDKTVTGDITVRPPAVFG